MQRLRFFARDDQLVPMPGVTPSVGQLPMYVGRKFDADVNGWPATREAAEFISGSPEAARAIELTRRDGALWPADEATAAACGVPFVAVKFVDGAFERVSAPKLAESREGN